MVKETTQEKTRIHYTVLSFVFLCKNIIILCNSFRIDLIKFEESENRFRLSLSLKSILIVFFSEFEVALGMSTNGAELGSFCSYNDVSAVAAFPNLNLALFEYLCGFNV